MTDQEYQEYCDAERALGKEPLTKDQAEDIAGVENIVKRAMKGALSTGAHIKIKVPGGTIEIG